MDPGESPPSVTSLPSFIKLSQNGTNSGLCGNHVLPIDRNEDVAFRDPRLALDGHVQCTSSEADRIGGFLSSTSMMSHPLTSGSAIRFRRSSVTNFSVGAQPRQNYSALCLQRSSNGFDDIDRNGKTHIL
ncbi:MAG: hypothetical protein OJF50_001808 [Nitrospira sp.]|nr:hypothetical protein [Nitrospira sp.]